MIERLDPWFGFAPKAQTLWRAAHSRLLPALRHGKKLAKDIPGGGAHRSGVVGVGHVGGLDHPPRAPGPGGALDPHRHPPAGPDPGR